MFLKIVATTGMMSRQIWEQITVMNLYPITTGMDASMPKSVSMSTTRTLTEVIGYTRLISY